MAECEMRIRLQGGKGQGLPVARERSYATPMFALQRRTRLRPTPRLVPHRDEQRESTKCRSISAPLPDENNVLGSVLVKLACESEARVMKSSTDCSEGGTNATAECKCHRTMRRRLCANGTNKLCSYAAIETVEESELLTASLSRAIVAAKYQRANVVARCQKSIDMQKMSKLEMRNRWGNQWIAKDKLRVDCNENTESRKHKIETRHTELRSLLCSGSTFCPGIK